jgi:hypothetical protein
MHRKDAAKAQERLGSALAPGMIAAGSSVSFSATGGHLRKRRGGKYRRRRSSREPIGRLLEHKGRSHQEGGFANVSV